ncbi:MAG: helix-turn-helix domain-containing protein [Planctomycetia bacterium]
MPARRPATAQEPAFPTRRFFTTRPQWRFSSQENGPARLPRPRVPIPAATARFPSCRSTHFNAARVSVVEFSHSTGLSLHRFVNRRRILRSLESLPDDSLSLAQIALDLGFASQSHFTRLFSMLTGMTPAKDRKQDRRTLGGRPPGPFRHAPLRSTSRRPPAGVSCPWAAPPGPHPGPAPAPPTRRRTSA